MRAGTQEEGKEHGDCLGESTIINQGCVNMAQEECMDWFIPFSRKLVPRGRVPPAKNELDTTSGKGW